MTPESRITKELLEADVRHNGSDQMLIDVAAARAGGATLTPDAERFVHEVILLGEYSVGHTMTHQATPESVGHIYEYCLCGAVRYMGRTGADRSWHICEKCKTGLRCDCSAESEENKK